MSTIRYRQRPAKSRRNKLQIIICFTGRSTSISASHGNGRKKKMMNKGLSLPIGSRRTLCLHEEQT
ncbi:hypothetical protein DPMN_191231 [Dreissena polymorpha]|uniref:Uncharacterized protein n=1 Tax=Dreissena polymorpha TaxID=45954 RepID=A0A9D3Y2F0_DREPO|nr:hypothetical protein DPMN_191231 [Dreissena polymorpha]